MTWSTGYYVEYHQCDINMFVKAMLPTRDQKTGKFRSPCSEALDPTPLSVKLTASMKQEIRQIAGSDMSAWIREAIISRLEQEKAAQSSQTS